MKTILTISSLLLAFAACSTPPERFAVPTPIQQRDAPRRAIAFQSIEVREVGLPVYAASEEITLQDETGALLTSPDLLWADAPGRAITLELARHLAALTDANVASEPWPFEGLADSRLDVRFETLLAGADGMYRARGQYFLSAEKEGQERSSHFDLAVPYEATAGLPALAAARGALIYKLAQTIARKAP